MAQHLEAQMALMKVQMAAQKTLQRDSAIKAEVSRHQVPQIKVVFDSFVFDFCLILFLKII